MKDNRAPLLRAVLILLTLSSLIAGCGGGTSSPASATSSTSSAGAAAAPTQSPAPPTLTAPPQAGARAIPYQAPGMTYNGLHATTSPTAAQVTDDLSLVKAHFKTIRTYYPQYNGNIDVDALANQQGLQVVLGLYIFADHPDWIESNYTQFVKPAIARGNVLAVLVGNEDPQDLALILQYLQRIKTDFPTLAVGTAQTTDFWLSDSRAQQVLPHVDFVAANIYPSWDWKNPVDYQPAISGSTVTPQAGFQTFTATYDSIAAKYAGKQIVVTETGWPTTYGWVVDTTPPPQPPQGISNAAAYLNLVKAWAAQNSVNVYMYSMFDDVYGVNTSSQYNFHFGLVDWQGKAKGVLF